MVDTPYKLVLVNVLAVILVSLFFFLYKFYKKKELPTVYLLLFIAILPVISILRKGMYESSDLGLHTAFSISLFNSLKDNILFPVWNAEILNGYGYPLYEFVYPLPYYLASILHLLGVSFIEGLKLIGGFFYILSGFAMYLLIKAETKKNIAGLIGAIFYLFAPYHLVDLHFRFAIGEVLAFFFVPFCFYLVKKIGQKNSYLYIFLLSLSVLGLLLSHQAISLTAAFFLVLYLSYLYLREKSFKSLLLRIIGLIIGVLISSFYWLPLLMESRYTRLLTMRVEFTNFLSLIASPNKYGLLFQGKNGELYFPIGYPQLIIVILSLCVFLFPVLRKKYSKSELITIIVSLISFFICFIMILPISKPLWDFLPLIKGFQFSYRLLVFCAFFISIMAGVILTRFNKKIIYLALGFTVLITILNWGNRHTLPQITDNTIMHELSPFPNMGWGNTIWTTNVNVFKNRHTNLEFIKGEGAVSEIARNTNIHKYIVNVSSENAYLKENTLYFPSWILRVDNKTHSFSYNYPSYPGIITFNLPKGLYKVEVIFSDTNVRLISRYISIFTLLIVTILMLSIFLKNMFIRLRYD
jgi:hypothetical protein